MSLTALEQEALAEISLDREQPFRWTDHLGLVRLLSVVGALCLWEFFGRQVNPLFLSYPSAIVRAFFQIIGAGEFQRQAMGSLQVFAAGLSVALVLGIALGLLMGRYRLCVYILCPFVFVVL